MTFSTTSVLECSIRSAALARFVDLGVDLFVAKVSGCVEQRQVRWLQYSCGREWLITWPSSSPRWVAFTMLQRSISSIRCQWLPHLLHRECVTGERGQLWN